MKREKDKMDTRWDYLSEIITHINARLPLWKLPPPLILDRCLSILYRETICSMKSRVLASVIFITKEFPIVKNFHLLRANIPNCEIRNHLKIKFHSNLRGNISSHNLRVIWIFWLNRNCVPRICYSLINRFLNIYVWMWL